MENEFEIIEEQDHISYYLSRIDRSVADNLKDIDNSFGVDGQLVFDFIMFMSKQLNNNLFGYTRFSLKDFANFVGINPNTLSAIHPDIESGREKAPFHNGVTFSSYFDFVLYKMLQRNIIFSYPYTYKEPVGNKVEIVKLQNFPILKDILIYHSNGKKKYYEVRLSDVIIEGIVKRYYTLDVSKLPIIGKGKGGHAKKKLYVFLNKMFHIYLTVGNSTQLTYSVDTLADIAGVRYSKTFNESGHQKEKLPKHKKEQVTRILTSLKEHTDCDKIHFSFSFTFIKSDNYRNEQEDYFVRFDFVSNVDNQGFSKKLTNDHILKLKVIQNLRELFEYKYPEETLKRLTSLKDEKDPFQRWLNNENIDLNLKIDIFRSAFKKVYFQEKNNELGDQEILDVIRNGFLSISKE